MTLERAYYRCQQCGEGFCPRDPALGLQDNGLSPAVTRTRGSVADLASFRRAAELLAELATGTVRAKQAERAAEIAVVSPTSPLPHPPCTSTSTERT
ncbi:MAG: hypothetical protein OXN89_09245 [Bryobacterales bacterium]|nr:hypothetical protein [Bryobacterales bacterium]